MSVVIDELEVEVQDLQAPAASQAMPPKKKQIRLRPMLQALCERDERLKAD